MSYKAELKKELTRIITKTPEARNLFLESLYKETKNNIYSINPNKPSCDDMLINSLWGLLITANFLSTFITRTYNNTFLNEDKQYIQWFNNLTPLLQGNAFLSYFDKTYNNKASNLRQVYYKRYIDGLKNGITIENLLSPNSENYIAKDIKNVLPKTSDLGSIVDSIAAEKNQSEFPPRLEGESALDYEKRTMSQ